MARKRRRPPGRPDDPSMPSVSVQFGGGRGDASTAGASLRHLYPYPLAALFRKIEATHEPAMRFGYALRFAEAAFRFVAVLGVVDACAGAPAKQVGKWLSVFKAPSMGKFLHVARSTGEWLDRHGSSLFPELLLLRNDQWEGATAAISEARNHFAHRQLALEGDHATAAMEELLPHITVVGRSLQFLEHLRLGSVRAVRQAGRDTWNLHWSDLRGAVEEGPMLILRSRAAVPEGCVMLLDPARDLAVPLAPFFWLDRSTEVVRLRWLDGVITDGPGTTGKYRHPILEGESCHPLSDPWRSEPGGISLDRWADEARDLHQPIELGLDVDSVERLLEGVRGLSGDDRYEIVGRLGSGASGTVWEVRNKPLDRAAALKVLRADLLASDRQVQRFVQEARLLAGLSHDRIVKVYAVDELVDGRPCIEMELLEGETVAEAIEARGALPAARAVEILVQVLEALEAVHAGEIVHRDVKPANVMLTDRGAVLLDFGVAKGGGALTRAGTISAMGTLPFLAPEQAAGKAEPRSDLYSAGRLLFAMLTGEAPTPMARPRLEAAPALVAVYECATEPEVSDRFRTAGEMRAALLTPAAPGAGAGAVAGAGAGAAPAAGHRSWKSRVAAAATSAGSALATAVGRGENRTPKPGARSDFDEFADFFFGSETGSFTRDEFDYDPFDDGRSSSVTEDASVPRAVVLEIPLELRQHAEGTRRFRPLSTLIEAGDRAAMEDRLLHRPEILCRTLAINENGRVLRWDGLADGLVVIDEGGGRLFRVFAGPLELSGLPEDGWVSDVLADADAAAPELVGPDPSPSLVFYLQGRRHQYDAEGQARRRKIAARFGRRLLIASFDRLLDALEGPAQGLGPDATWPGAGGETLD